MKSLTLVFDSLSLQNTALAKGVIKAAVAVLESLKSKNEQYFIKRRPKAATNQR